MKFLPGQKLLGLVHPDDKVEIFSTVEDMLAAYGDGLHGMTALKLTVDAFTTLEVIKEGAGGIPYKQ